MRAACIDIGSNTTRLLVADRHQGRLEIVHQARAFTRIGVELQRHGAISPAKRREVVGVVAEQLAAARELQAGAVHGVATAAIRAAVNGEQLVEEIDRATGLAVRVLSDGEEARLAFTGAVGMLERPPTGPLGVVDVGGGSSEVVVGDPSGAIHWWRSLPVGSGVLAHRRLSSDPPSATELQAAREEVAGAVAALAPGQPLPERTLAVGGSATSLCRVAGEILDPPALAGALGILASAPAAQVAARFDIDCERARLLPAGLLILEALARRLGGVIAVGRGGIREGVLLEAGES